jgi:hypothetical protein
MIVPKKNTKNFRRALALAFAIGSFLGVTSAPALATPFDPDNPTWTLNVQVSDSTCVPNVQPADWSPMEMMMTGNTNVDLFSPADVTFEVALGFSPGMDMNACGLGDYYPTGDVVASFNGDAALNLETLNCQIACSATDLYNSLSTIQGSVSVVAGTAPGNYSGTLSVVWTPAG